MSDPLFSGLDEFIQSNRQRFEDYLKRLVEVPTVSADPAHKAHMTEGAELAAGFLTEIGLDAKVVPTKGSPVVLGQYIGDDKWPTVTLYNHLDVQPAELSEWRSEPFKLQIDGDKYLGRGATDDKGPALTAMMAMDYAIKNKLPLNFNVVWELEEEVGSPNFKQFIKEQHQALAGTDSVLVSDSIWISPERPTVDYGLRGLMTFEMRLRTAEQDVHSGLAGGVARNPLAELAAVITACFDAQTGKVKIPGFYDDARVASEAELQNFVDSGFDIDDFKQAHQLKLLRTSDNKQAVSRIMAEPTFEVHGIVGGYSGPGVKTVIPPTGVAKISTRLVPAQKPAKIFELVKQYVAKLNPDVEVVLGEMLEAYQSEFEGPYADAARGAIEFAFGVKPAFVREGGSIGAVLTMQQELGVPIVMTGLSLPEHGYHAPNENYDWHQASGGIKQFVKYFSEIAKIKA